MTIQKTLKLVFLVILFANYALQPAEAHGPQYVKAVDRCGKKFGTPNVMAICIKQEEQRVGDRLQSLYDALRKKFSNSAEQKLKMSQMGWLQYQKETCQLEKFSEREVQYRKLSEAKCLLRTTIIRNNEFSQLYELVMRSEDDFISAKAFQTPSGNIHCLLDDFGSENGQYEAYLRCDILQISSNEPRRPKDCEYEWGKAFGLEKTNKRGFLICHSDTTYNQNAPVLDYGGVWTGSGFTCKSKRTGLSCYNAQRHGFTLSRKAQKTF